MILNRNLVFLFCLYVTRIQIAILHLEEQVVRWPDADERRIISTRILQKYGFPNCVGSRVWTGRILTWYVSQRCTMRITKLEKGRTP